MKKISIVVPVYYNHDNLLPLYADLKEKVLSKLDIGYELIFSLDLKHILQTYLIHIFLKICIIFFCQNKTYLTYPLKLIYKWYYILKFT